VLNNTSRFLDKNPTGIFRRTLSQFQALLGEKFNKKYPNTKMATFT